MAVTLTAVNVPLPPLPTSVIFAEDERIVTGTPPRSGPYRQGTIGSNLVSTLNRDMTQNDVVAARGAGVFAVYNGLDPTIGTLLNVDVTAGQAIANGLLEKTATEAVAIDPSIARAQIWLKQDNTFEVVNNSLTPPAGDVVYIGSAVTNGTNVTSVDTSGVMFYKQGHSWRETADALVPADSPGTSRRFWHRTANDTFYWDGLSYILMAGTTVREGLHADRVGLVDGDIWLSTDGLYLERFDGAVFTQYGPLFGVVQPPAVASFTNKGAAMDIAIDSKGSVYFEKDESAADDTALRVVAETPPYTVELGYLPNQARANDWQIGLAFYEDATGKFMQIHSVQLAVVVSRWTDFENRLSTDRFRNWYMGNPQFLKVEDNNTNLIFSIGGDGINWIEVFTVARGDHFTTAPDRVGVTLNANVVSEPSSIGVTVFHWRVT